MQFKNNESVCLVAYNIQQGDNDGSLGGRKFECFFIVCLMMCLHETPTRKLTSC